MKKYIMPVLVAGSLASPAFSVTTDIDFSFAGVEGTFYGVDTSDGTSSAATYSLSYDGVTINGTQPFTSNAFTYEDGFLSEVHFNDGTAPSSGDVILASFTLAGSGNFFSGSATFIDTGDFTFESLSGEATIEGTAPAPTPIPLSASGWMLLAAMIASVGSLVSLRRRVRS